MTSIAYRDGIMAADSGMFGGYFLRGWTRKIERSPDGSLAGAAGQASLCALFREAFASGHIQRGQPFDTGTAEPQDFGALIAWIDGSVSILDHKGRMFPAPEAPFHVDGSGEEIMIGALAAGASAEEAVRIAIQYSQSSAGEVQVERLGVAR